MPALLIVFLAVSGAQGADFPLASPQVRSHVTRANHDSLNFTEFDGYSAGLKSGSRVSTSGNFYWGIATSVLFPVAGPLVLYGLTEESEVPDHLTNRNHSMGAEYALGFERGYKERSRKVKRRETLWGALAGEAALFWVWWFFIR